MPLDELPEQVAVRSAEAEALWSAVAALPQPLREAMRLRYVEELSLHQVAKRSGVSHQTASNRLAAGLSKLREALVT